MIARGQNFGNASHFTALVFLSCPLALVREPDKSHLSMHLREPEVHEQICQPAQNLRAPSFSASAALEAEALLLSVRSLERGARRVPKGMALFRRTFSATNFAHVSKGKDCNAMQGIGLKFCCQVWQLPARDKHSAKKTSKRPKLRSVLSPTAEDCLLLRVFHNAHTQA